jgi:hypothetical protein
MSALLVLLTIVGVFAVGWGCYRVWRWRHKTATPAKPTADEVVEKFDRVAKRLDESSTVLRDQIQLYVTNHEDAGKR